ncbi:MAG: methyltransferase family protein [Promethearchaeota archaeon]
MDLTPESRPLVCWPIPVDHAVTDWIRVVFGLGTCVVGGLTVRAALATFGLDYMGLVYLYFPEESELQDHEIYSVLRHPTYVGAMVICAGGMLLQFTPYSVLFFAIQVTGFHAHVRLVEERELVRRFGDSFLQYRKSTPAFFVRPKNWGKFLRFIAGRGSAAAAETGSEPETSVSP